MAGVLLRSSKNWIYLCSKQTCVIQRCFSKEYVPPISSYKSPYKHGIHRSNAEELIAKVPVIEVDDTVAVCDGGGGILGHPLEYIQLNTVSKEPQACKYCGLRFKKSSHHHH